MEAKKKYPFPSNHRDDWLKAAHKELGSKDPMAELTKVVNGLSIRPYYDSSDLTLTSPDTLPVSEGGYLGARAWINAPMVEVRNESEANSKALEHLKAGADGILFKVKPEVDLAKLLTDIQLPYCSVSFLHVAGSFIQSFSDWLEHKDLTTANLSGSLFAPQFQSPDLYRRVTGVAGLHPCGIEIPASTPAAELHFALSAVVRQLEPIETQAEVDHFLSQAAFCFSVGTNFFEEIAKLKSFRRLWKQLLAAYHVKALVSPHIHAISQKWSGEKLDPNANMLKSTTATLAAILGGANAVTTCEDMDQPFKSRIARNVSLILREESRLSLVGDPTAGSYFLESIIQTLTESVWAELEKEVDS